MGKTDSSKLIKFLKPFPPDVREKALALREFVWDLYPEANELIYDNYNAVAVGWSPTDRVGHVFCNVAVGRSSHNVQFGFYWGAKIKDPEKKLIGSGNQYRYFRVESMDDFPKKYIVRLMNEAYVYSLSLVKDKSQLTKGETIVKSVSEKKRPGKKKAVARKSGPKKRSGKP